MSREVRLLCPAMLALAVAAMLAQCSNALALSGAAPVIAKGSTALGPAQGQKSVVLTLTPRDGEALRALSSSSNALPITASQFMASFAPTTATVAAVTSWAEANGVAVSSVSSDRLLVKLSGSSAALGSALGVSFERYRAEDGSEYTSTLGTASTPASIAPDVSAITGLSSLERAHSELVRPSATEAPTVDYPASYGPEQLWAIYHAPADATGKGQQVSIISAGDIAGVEADLRTFESKFGLAKVKWRQVTVGSPGSETEGDDEWDLDTQYSTGFAPGVKELNVYVGNSMEDEAILETIDRWVTEDKTTQASFSAGECELLADVAGFSTSLDTVLAEAAAEGRTLFTSAGDTGSQCPVLVGENGVPAGTPGVNYPASSPYAIGVGGTSILGPEEEIGWYSGGGGQSVIESAPAWQGNAGGSFVGATRGVPDVSIDADPESGVEVIIDGKEEVIGGTSVGAPSWQGIWARVEGAARKHELGFAGPVIYESEPEAAFKDIILGDNGLYPCTPGWDYVTGRGTPVIEALVAGA
jgi:pseudomonalisin